MTSTLASTFSAKIKPLLLAGLMATAGFATYAQTAPAAPAEGQHRGMKHHGPKDPAKRAEMHAKHQADLKARLKIEASQEAAWSTFTASMTPPAGARPDRAAMHAEMQKLTTPERIDKMKALHAQRDAEMSKRADAAKTFYAALNADQKKVFDTQGMRGGPGGKHGGGHERGHGGGHGAGHSRS